MTGAHVTAGAYCTWCGQPADEGEHGRCARRPAWLDPPRYCPRCARRMVVQVSPSGWVARCSRHGELDQRQWLSTRQERADPEATGTV